MLHGFESRYVSEVVKYTSSNNTEALVVFINNHSDEQLIKVRADLKEYIGKSDSMSNLLAVLSIYVAVVAAVFSSLHSKLSDLYVEHAAFWIAIFTVPMIVCFFMYMMTLIEKGQKKSTFCTMIKTIPRAFGSG